MEGKRKVFSLFGCAGAGGRGMQCKVVFVEKRTTFSNNSVSRMEKWPTVCQAPRMGILSGHFQKEQTQAKVTSFENPTGEAK